MKNNSWELFQQEAEAIREQPSDEVWSRIEKKLTGNKNEKRIVLRRRIRIAIASAAAGMLLLLVFLPEGASSGDSYGMAHQIQDIGQDRVIAESFLEKVEWSARNIQVNAPITEGSEFKRLMPRIH